MFNREHQNHIKDGLKHHHWFLMHLIRNLRENVKELRMREGICIRNLANKLRKAEILCSLKRVLQELCKNQSEVGKKRVKQELI